MKGKTLDKSLIEVHEEKCGKKVSEWSVQDWREYYLTEPKVKTYIPKRDGEPKDSTEFISVNGVGNHFKKGVFIELPQTFAEVIAQSYGLLNEASVVSPQDSGSGAKEMDLSKNEETRSKLA
jgi:hypothetical protein